MENFEFFNPKLGRELGGGGWIWVVVEMGWVELDGAAWRWVHGLVIPLKKFISYTSRATLWQKTVF